MALASNSPRDNIETKISFQNGILLKDLVHFIYEMESCEVGHGLRMFWLVFLIIIIILVYLSLFFHCYLHLGWKESFSVIIGGDEVKSGKPSPEMSDAKTIADLIDYYFS